MYPQNWNQKSRRWRLKPLNLETLIGEYLDYLRYEKQSSPDTCTVRFYELRMFCHYMKKQGIEDLREIRVYHLRSYISHLSIERNYQAVSICNAISGMRAFYNYALERGGVAANIARKIRKPRVEPTEVEHFRWEEVEAIFLAVPRTSKYLRNLCVLFMFYYCSLRLDELRNTRVSDLSEDFSELHIERGKGDKTRLLPIHPFLQRALRLYLRTLKDKNSYLFPGQKGGPLSKTRIGKIVKECGKEAGIDKRVSPHIFRHSFATHLHQKGVDINRLSQLLGHANIEKTAIYTHTEDEELIEAVRKLESSPEAGKSY